MKEEKNFMERVRISIFGTPACLGIIGATVLVVLLGKFLPITLAAGLTSLCAIATFCVFVYAIYISISKKITEKQQKRYDKINRGIVRYIIGSAYDTSQIITAAICIAIIYMTTRYSNMLVIVLTFIFIVLVLTGRLSMFENVEEDDKDTKGNNDSENNNNKKNTEKAFSLTAIFAPVVAFFASIKQEIADRMHVRAKMKEFKKLHSKAYMEKVSKESEENRENNKSETTSDKTIVISSKIASEETSEEISEETSEITSEEENIEKEGIFKKVNERIKAFILGGRRVMSITAGKLKSNKKNLITLVLLVAMVIGSTFAFRSCLSNNKNQKTTSQVTTEKRLLNEATERIERLEKENQRLKNELVDQKIINEQLKKEPNDLEAAQDEKEETETTTQESNSNNDTVSQNNPGYSNPLPSKPIITKPAPVVPNPPAKDPELPQVVPPTTPVVEDKIAPVVSLEGKNKSKVGEKIEITINTADANLKTTFLEKLTVSPKAEMTVSKVSNEKVKVTLAFEEAGDYTFEVGKGYAIDEAGNESMKSVLKINVEALPVEETDKVKPIVSVQGPKEAKVGETVKFYIKGEDANLKSINSDLMTLTPYNKMTVNKVSENTVECEITFEKAGEYTLNINEGFATDKIGNLSEELKVNITIKTEEIIAPKDEESPVLSATHTDAKIFESFEVILTMKDNTAIDKVNFTENSVKLEEGVKLLDWSLISENQIKLIVQVDTLQAVKDGTKITFVEGIATDAAGNTSKELTIDVPVKGITIDKPIPEALELELRAPKFVVSGKSFTVTAVPIKGSLEHYILDRDTIELPEGIFLQAFDQNDSRIEMTFGTDTNVTGTIEFSLEGANNTVTINIVPEEPQIELPEPKPETEELETKPETDESESKPETEESETETETEKSDSETETEKSDSKTETEDSKDQCKDECQDKEQINDSNSTIETPSESVDDYEIIDNTSKDQWEEIEIVDETITDEQEEELIKEEISVEEPVFGN